MASTLLGTQPPRLSGRLLVAFAEEFGINPGTTRVALSRMVDNGEIERSGDGVYQLCGPLLERQRRQEVGLAPLTRRWRGSWEIHIVRAGARESSHRAALRRAALHLGLREQRDGVWLRPDNLDPGRLASEQAVLGAQADRFIGEPTGATDPAVLASALFDTDRWAAGARDLTKNMRRMISRLNSDGPAPLAEGFELAAASLRHLVADPQLPEELCPPNWPEPALRVAYDSYDAAYRRQLSGFFRSRSRLNQ